MATTTTILIAERDPKVVAHLKALIEPQPEYEIVADAADGRSAFGLASQLRPDMLIVSIDIPVMNGFELAGEMRKAGISTNIVFVTPGRENLIGTDEFVNCIAAVS